MRLTLSVKTSKISVGGVGGHVLFFKFIPFSLSPLLPF